MRQMANELNVGTNSIMAAVMEMVGKWKTIKVQPLITTAAKQKRLEGSKVLFRFMKKKALSTVIIINYKKLFKTDRTSQ